LDYCAAITLLLLLLLLQLFSITMTTSTTTTISVVTMVFYLRTLTMAVAIWLYMLVDAYVTATTGLRSLRTTQDITPESVDDAIEAFNEEVM
jgi:hypothetical protein